MFGKYDISLTEATHVKNYLLKNKLVSHRIPIFGNLLRTDLEKELALDFNEEYEESIKLGPTGPSPSQYNTQRNFASFAKPQLKIILLKDKKVEVTLTLTCAFGTLESGRRGVSREGLIVYSAEVPIDQLFKI